MRVLVFRLTPVLVILAGIGLLAGSAAANFPGRNGPIYYSAPNPKSPTSAAHAVSIPYICIPTGSPPPPYPDEICPPRVQGPSDGTDIVMQKQGELRAKAFTDTPGVSESAPRVSADGQRVLFRRGAYEGRPAGFYTAGRGDTNERFVVPETDGATYWYTAMTWAPDGRLAAVRCKTTSYGYWTRPCEIVTLNSDGSGITPVNAPAGSYGVIEPDLSVSPDGTEVVYAVGGRDVNDHTIVAKLDGSGARDLGEGESPDISPDGSTIAFTLDTRRVDCTEEIWTMSAADGSQRSKVTGSECTEQRSREKYPEWSPDGRWIAYLGWTDYVGYDLGLIRADGSARDQLVLTNVAGSTVSWGRPPGPSRMK